MTALAPPLPVLSTDTPNVLPESSVPPSTETVLTEPTAGPSQPPKDTPATPTTPPVPSSDSNEIMSEGHSDWEKVEKPQQSPPKGKAVKPASAKKDDKEVGKEGGFKGKVGEVKRVFKSGMFGSSPKASPTTATTTKPYVPARAAGVRASLGPPRKAALPPPPPAKASTITTAARATPPTSASATVPKPAVPSARSRVSTLLKPASSETIKPNSALGRAGSLSSRPTPGITSTIGARATKPVVASGTSSTRAGASPTGSTGSAATATAAAPGVARKRVSAGPIKTTATAAAKAPLARAPLATPTSIKPAGSRQVSGGQAEALASLARAKEEKESAEKELGSLKVKVDELEAALSAAKTTSDEKAAEQAQVRAELEESHALAIEKIRAEIASQHQTTSDSAKAESEAKIAELQAVHTRELAASDEQRESQAQQVEHQIADLTQAVQSVSQQHTDALTQLQSAQDKLAESAAAHLDTQEQVGALQRQLDQLNQESQAHEADMSALATRLDDVVKEKEGLEREIKDGNDEAERSMVDLGGMKGRVEELEEEIEGLKGLLAGKEAEIERVRQSMAEEIEAVHNELKESKGKIAGLALALSKSEEAAKTQEDKFKAITDERDSLLDQIKILTGSTAEHDAEVHRLKVELDDAEAEHVKLSQTVLDSTARVETLEAALSAVEAKAEALEDNVAEAEEKVRGLESRLKEVEVGQKGFEEEKEMLTERINLLESEIEHKEGEHKAAYASFEDAKSKATTHHANELSAIRSQLVDTHSQLQEAHSAELESTAANHAAYLSSLSSDHATEVGELKMMLKKLEEELSGLRQAEGIRAMEVDGLVGKLERAEEELEGLKVELEGKKDGDQEIEEKLEVALRELAGVRDELEGTKEVLEMNKSHFQSSLEEMQGQHTRELHESAAGREEEEIEREDGLKAAKAEKEEMLAQVEKLKKELKDREAAENIDKAQALEGMVSQKEVEVKIGHLTAEHQEEVSRLESWVEQLQSQITASAKPTPAAPPKILDRVITSHPSSTVEISSPARGSTFQAPKTPSPKRPVVPVVDIASPTPASASSGLKADLTPSKIPIPASPLVAAAEKAPVGVVMVDSDDEEVPRVAAAGNASGRIVMEDSEEEDMDVEGEGDSALVSSVGSLGGDAVPLVATAAV